MSTPRYQHVQFYKLNIGEEFFTKTFCYAKTGFFTGRCVQDGELIFVSPWRKVRSTRPFGKQPPTPYPTELQTLTGKGPTVDVRPTRLGWSADDTCEGVNNVCLGKPTTVEGQQVILAPRPPQKVSIESIGGSELPPL